MGVVSEYQRALSQALDARREWLEKTELPRLKEEFRTFHTAFGALYNLFLKKGLINEDPYKNEIKMGGEIEVPETGPLTDADRTEQFSIRLSNYDNQLDFLVNFHQFSMDFLSLDKIKRILGLVKYIDWVRLTDNSATPNTRIMEELLNHAKTGADQLALSIINESLVNLTKATGNILKSLKELSNFDREAYKLELRNNITAAMPAGDALGLPQVKKKFAALMPGKPFYPDLVEEVLKEDYSKAGPGLQQNILKQLAVPENKPVIAKPAVSFKSILIEGLNSIGSAAVTLVEIEPKLEENKILLESLKNGFWDKLRQLMQQIIKKEPDPVIYEIEYPDPVKGIPVREQVNFNNFCSDMERKVRVLMTLGSRGAAAARLEAMDETQLLGLLEKNIRDVQSLHKILSALDEYFKAKIGKEDREKVRGIKPELATVKNAIVKANQRRHEFSAQKEEEEQLKRLGINSRV
jgi:hypothetical protein